MNKNTTLGLLIIGAVFLGFSWYNARQAAKYNAEKARQDSIALVNERLAAQSGLSADEFSGGIISPDSLQAAMPTDSARALQLGKTLFNATRGEEQVYTISNNLIAVSVSNLGAKVKGVRLKEFNRYNGEPVELYAEGSAQFDLSFFVMKDFNNAQINTSEFYFTSDQPREITVSENDGDKRLVMRLPVDTASYVEYIYTLKANDYMVGFDVRFVNMEAHFSNQTDMVVTWESVGPQHEKGFENENNFSTIAYKFPGADRIEDLGISKSTKEKIVNSQIKWIAFKQQFFSVAFIADDSFANAALRYDTFQPWEGNIKRFAASIAVPFNKQVAEYNFNFYFGPNKYSILRQYGIGLEKLIPLGWWIIGGINRLIVIPVFGLLSESIASFGIIILLLTIFIKIIILPLTYRSYLSTAKMRLLKPETDEISAKYPKQEDAMKKQQAMMQLYKRAGVNPMGGCLPLLIQMPILIAMFRFFPASIELRGQSFLWADDLSSYDSIFRLPFEIPFYGDHISLFTLLMAVSLHFTSRISMAQQQAAPQMAGMKFMSLWLMPVMLLLWFNNYASGLTYYYLLSNLFTMGQTYGFRYIVNDEKLHARMKQNAAKKPKKKSKWQQRYQEMMKAQQQQAQQTKKKR